MDREVGRLAVYHIWQKRIIDYYIIKEILVPFLVGVAIIAIIMISSFLFQLTDLIIIKQVPMNTVLRLFIFQLPEVIVQTFPIAILFATMWGMSRLSRENEFTALRMGGISLYRLIFPLIILGILISALTFFINEEVVPWTNHEARNIIRRSILKQAMPDIQENVFFKGPEGRLFFVNRFDESNNILENIVIYNLPDKASFPEVITARKGVVIDNKWRLEGGIIHQFNEEGELHRGIMFGEMEYEIAKEVENFFGEQRTTAEMSRERLKKDIELFQKSGINTDSLLIDYHLKLSMPLAALIFIVIGTPLSLSARDSRSASIIFTIVIVFSYYLVLSLSQSFGKNGKLPPLLAAWLPNLLFGVIGVILLVWRETWQNWVSRFLPGIFSILVFLVLFCPVVRADNTASRSETLKIYQAEQLTYNDEQAKFELSGEIIGQYSQYHIFAEKVTIKLEDGEEKTFSRPGEIKLEEGKFTGCDLEEPHYYFDAAEVIIYPEDHLVARHVFFRELKGSLPLFYWPYLYISLKDKSQRLIPEIGYNARRGWFIKTTYYYWYDDRLPGEFYLDYYTISGFGGGFKQHFLYEPDLKGFIYLYSQENRTSIPGLFDWQGRININDQKGNWKTDTDLNYTYYDDYSLLSGRINLNNKTERQNLNLSSSFDSKDYFITDNNDDKKLDLDLNYQVELIKEWQLNLNYNQDYIFNPEDGLKKRWGSKTYLSRRFDRLNVRIIMERFAPQFTEEEDEEERVSFYRWPEVDLSYTPSGSFSYNLQAGRYYEDSSGIEGYRGMGRVNYSKYFNLGKSNRVSVKQSLNGSLYHQEESEPDYYQQYYQEIPYQVSYESQFNITTSITRGLTWNNTYNYRDFIGDTPFNFDKVRTRERVDSKLNYRNGGLNLNLSTGYDIYNAQYSPITGIMNWQITPEWKIGMGTTYNLETALFGDLAVTSNYKSEIWQVNSAIKYNLNDRVLKQVDNQLVYDLDKEWYLEVNTSYDKENENIKKANLVIKKNFHCREISFSYDYLKKEYTLEYHINLFPDHGVKVGSSEEDPFMFDLGIKDMLGI